MDKNLVNIDDLFRQRLSGGEEKERAGAWANMSELLDKEMPAKRAMGMPWRRMLTYTTGLVLLASMAFGGYEVMSAHRNVAETEAGIAGTGSNGTGTNKVSTPGALSAATQDPSASTENAHISKATNGILATHAAVNTSGGGTITSNGTVGIHTAAIATNATQQTPAKGIHNIVKNIAKVSSATHTANSTSGVMRSSHIVSVTPVSKNINAPSQSGLTSNTSVAGVHKNNNNLNINNLGSPTSSIASVSSIVSSGKVTASTNHTKGKKGGSKNVAGNTIAASGHAVTSSHGQNIDDKVAVDVAEKIKLDKIEVVEHYVSKSGGREGHYKNDTIDKSEVYDTRYVQAPGSSVTTAASSTIAKGNANQTATNATAGNFKNALYASTAKTTGLSNNGATITTHSKKRSVTLANFGDMVRDFRNNLGNATFAPGITGGINATFFAPNGITGFQIGVTGNVVFNDNWSFMAELKYFTRFSGNAVISDNYVNYTALGNGYYRRDSTEHFFKYNNLQSVELPLTVRYTDRKLGMFAGVNLAYDFAINNDFVDYHYAYQITNELSNNVQPKFSENDFVSRFGVGYVIGASYNITPLLHADARIVQTLWDNSSTSGSQSISKDFYKHPSLQLSIGYTLKKKENKMP